MPTGSGSQHHHYCTSSPAKKGQIVLVQGNQTGFFNQMLIDQQVIPKKKLLKAFLVNVNLREIIFLLTNLRLETN